MSKAKLAAAQAYIEAKEYDHAREILYTINDPTVEQWLEHLERIDPNGSNHSYLSPALRMSTQMKAADTRPSNYSTIGRILFVLGIFSVLRFVYLANQDMILITQPIAIFFWYRFYVFWAGLKGYRP
jgi:hypothetical protein